MKTNESIEEENTIEIPTDRPLVPESFDVKLNSWEVGTWKGKKFVTLEIRLLEGKFELFLWPSEANCMMDMLQNVLGGLDLDYDSTRAYQDLVDAGKAEPIPEELRKE